MLGSELPSWKQILTNKYSAKTAENAYWKGENLIWTSRSGISIRLIAESCAAHIKKDMVRMWIPDLFCVETEELFVTKKVQLDYYPIHGNYEPDWDIIKEMTGNSIPDIFIFVHYFGVYHDVDRAKEFCKRYGTLLIEDCAHVLYPSGKFGLKGDFTVFSPHKILPVCDGGIIKYNEKDDKAQAIADGLKKQLVGEKQSGNCIGWRIKKAVQKITKARRATKFTVGAHFAARKEESVSKFRLRISRWSYHAISGYRYEEFKKIAYIRRMNLRTMNYIVSRLTPEAVPIVPEDTVCPYAAMYSVKNIKDKQEAVRKLERAGILVTYWPTLSDAVKEMTYKSMAADLSGNLLVIPIHQGMTPQYLLKEYLPDLKKTNRNYQFEKINDGAEYGQVCRNEGNVLDNVPQDWIYGVVKSETAGDELNRYKICGSDGRFIGFMQALIKKKAGIKYAVRVNRGPVMQKGYEGADVVFSIMERFRKMMRPLPVFYAPNLEFSPYNMHVATSYHWRCWNGFGYPSGIINLEESEEMLRKKLDSKWRNQLISAEKRGLAVLNDNARYKEFLEIYRKDQQDKNYKGISNDILLRLFTFKESPLETYYAADENGGVLAFDIVYLQRETAHYLVGWNSAEGRKLYLNNLLLFYALISLKQKGMKRFDLGGIEYIHTEDIAKFKDGMNPEKYHLMGEFVGV